MKNIVYKPRAAAEPPKKSKEAFIMLLNAGMIFDINQDDFYVAIREPECAKDFKKKYIYPAGDDVDAEYGYLIGQYQREAFIVGFRAAVQLLMDCSGQSGVVIPQVYLPQKDENSTIE